MADDYKFWSKNMERHIGHSLKPIAGSEGNCLGIGNT
jgi:hypothetical protein